MPQTSDTIVVRAAVGGLASPIREIQIGAAQWIGSTVGDRARAAGWPPAAFEALILTAGALASGDHDARDRLADLLSRPIPPAGGQWTVAAMLDGLQSDSLAMRILSGQYLAASVAGGMRVSGASALDWEHGAGRDVCDLIGIASIRLDEAEADRAIATLREVLSADPSQAAATPTEAPNLGDFPEPVLDHLRTHSPLSALDALADTPPAERGAIVQALHILAGAELSGRVPYAVAREFLALRDGLIAGDPSAIDAAREWLTLHLFAARPVADHEEPCHD